MPDGSSVDYRFFPSAVMPKALGGKYPNIKTWAGQATDGSASWARIDLTPSGFHGMVKTTQGTIYIDPYSVRDGRAIEVAYVAKSRDALAVHRLIAHHAPAADL